MRLLDLPPAILAILFSDAVLGIPTATPLNTPIPDLNERQTAPQVTTGTSYATSCASAYWSYSSAYDAWSREHRMVSNQTQVVGGTSISDVTYYANATTLCDGHPRVTYSPAISLSTARVTYPHPASYTSVDQITYFANFPSSAPSCSIAPTDCDPLWSAYSLSSSAWQARNITRTKDVAATARITAPPQTPNCMNQSEASSYASATESIFGCGLCTIYGEGVGLVYFPEPTTVSRDMCATTPSASLTHYGPGAVIRAYAGTEYGLNASAAPPGAETAILGRNTFVSGAAYISIATVWAEDRCSSTLGTPVSNAILAMPSESVLSLRYKQDHFQYFMSTDTQTGYPVSYADFNKPVPFSAWIGQARCEGQWDTWDCGVVYEDDFRPQLAIPPEIRQLNPEWQGCQMWYGGLYDPPVALQPQQSIAAPTIPVQLSEMGSTTAMPSQTASAPTSAPTALPDQNGGGEGGSQGGGSRPSTPTGLPINGGSGPGSGNGWHAAFTANGQIWQASACGEQQACVHGTAISSGGPAKTISGGVVASYGPNGLVVEGTSTLASLQQMTVDGGTGTLASPQQTTMGSNGIEGPSRPLDTTVNTAVEFSNGLVVAWSSTINIEGNGAVIASDTAAPNSDQNAATTGPQASSIAVDGQSGVSATAASLQSTATNPPSPTGSFQGSSDTTSSGSSDAAASSTRIDSPTSNDGAASAPPQLQLFAALVLTMIMMYVS